MKIIKTPVFLICFLIILDHCLKIYVKTHFYLNEVYPIATPWLKIHFVENPGFIYGISFGGYFGKVNLTINRILLTILYCFILKWFQYYKLNLKIIVAMCCIIAGSIGNTIDNIFYASIFSDSALNPLMPAHILPNPVWYKLFFGSAIDMLNLPFLNYIQFPHWLPIWGGQKIEFLNYVFNLADLFINIGIVLMCTQIKYLFTKMKTLDLYLQHKITQKETHKTPDGFYFLIFIVTITCILFFANINTFSLKLRLNVYAQIIPAINAMLNSGVAICLCLGFMFALQNKFNWHQKMMWTALIISCIFFTLFICHIVVNGLVKFGDLNHDNMLSNAELEQAKYWQFIYYGLLSVHIFIACIVLPLVLITVYHSLKKNILIHKTLGKYLFWLWLFVSVSGPIIWYIGKAYY
ncbi:MAG: DUF420 domain-containing protein [Alphaproteobacteria bacterium]|nr:DUF420 domain-containing protein [Alphaproteobacteria bacterium]